jgi:hypothetical protein
VAPNLYAAMGTVAPTMYAAQGTFKPRGTDTVPAMLTPGELVIPRQDSADVLSGKTSISSPRAGDDRQGSHSLVGGRLTATPTASSPRGGADVSQAMAALTRTVERSIATMTALGARGSSPRPVSITVNAVDQKGVREMLIDNSEALSEALDYLDARAT